MSSSLEILQNYRNLGHKNHSIKKSFGLLKKYFRVSSQMSMIITQDIKPFVWEKLGLFINLNFFKNFIKKFSKSYHTAKHSYNFAFDVIKSQRDVTNISTIFLLTSSLVDIYEKLKNTLYHHNQKTRFFCPATFQKPTKTRKPQA